MESLPLLSSQDGPGRVQLEGFGPTRNRKVVGSNPFSGSTNQQLRAPISPPLRLPQLGGVSGVKVVELQRKLVRLWIG